MLQLYEPSNAFYHNFPPFFGYRGSVSSVSISKRRRYGCVKVWEVYVIWKRLIKVLSMCKLMGSDYAEKTHGFLPKVWQKLVFLCLENLWWALRRLIDAQYRRKMCVPLPQASLSAICSKIKRLHQKLNDFLCKRGWKCSILCPKPYNIWMDYKMQQFCNDLQTESVHPLFLILPPLCHTWHSFPIRRILLNVHIDLYSKSTNRTSQIGRCFYPHN